MKPHPEPHITDCLHNKKWGVFLHYLHDRQNNPNHPACTLKTATTWDACVNELDVNLIARQLKETRAGYAILTVMQRTKHFCAPNETFNQLTGYKSGEAASRRDLILDLHNALNACGIDVYLYFSGDGPSSDPVASKVFGFEDSRVLPITLENNGITNEFVRKWASVLREYAVRYGDKIKGWWFDGCYTSDIFGDKGYDDAKLKIYKDAIRSGNLNAVVAFNNGVKNRVSFYSAHDDFLAGEMSDFVDLPDARFINGKQWHILAPLGLPPPDNPWGAWCKPGAKRSDEYMRDYVECVHQKGGVVTIDVCLRRNGEIPREQLDVLRAI
jgi:hypothetical protein